MLGRFSVVLLVVQLLLLASNGYAVPAEQELLKEDGDFESVRHSLKKAEIIPTVIPDFTPLLTLSVSWPKDSAELGNTLKVKHVQDEPKILLTNGKRGKYVNENITYVITLTDPDAPKRDDPEWSEMCHWIASGTAEPSDNHTIIPYKAPGPPPKTGKHRYVFLAFAPANGTTEPLNFTAPSERKHWGSGEERVGVAWWAEKHGLVPIGANFLYAKNKKQ